MPVLGNALQVQTDTLHQQAEQWTRKYGSVFRFRIASRQFVVMSDPEMVAAVLRDRPDGFQRTARLTETSREMGFVGLFAANGEDWKRHRPMVLRGLDPTHIKTFHPTLQRVTDRLRLRWERAAGSGAAIDLQADLMRYTVDVTAGLAFGTDMNTLESDEEVIQSHLDKVLPALFKRVLSPCPTGTGSSCRRTASSTAIWSRCTPPSTGSSPTRASGSSTGRSCANTRAT